MADSITTRQQLEQVETDYRLSEAIKADQATDTMTPAQTLDAIDLGYAAEDNAAATDDLEGIDSAFSDTFQMVSDSYAAGGDGREAGKDVIKAANEIETQDLLNEVNSLLGDSTRSVEDRLAAIEAAKANTTNKVRLFTDPSAAKKSFQVNELEKSLDKGAPLTEGREGWDTSNYMTLFGEVNEQDRQRAYEGFIDAYAGDVLLVPQLLWGGIQDFVTNFNKGVRGEDIEDTRHAKVKESFDDYMAWQAYLESKSQDDPEGYGKGVGPGRATGFFIDPAFAGVAKVASLTTKSAVRTAHTAATLNHLKKVVGKTETANITRASVEGLAEMYRVGDDTFKKALDTVKMGDSNLSDKIGKAVELVKGSEILSDEVMKTAASPMSHVVREAVKAQDHDAMDRTKDILLSANTVNGEKLKKAFETGEHTPLALVGTPHSGVANPTTSYGVKLNNAASVSPAADALRFDVVSQRQALVEGIHSVRWTQLSKDIEELSMGVTAETWAKQTRNKYLRFTLPGVAKFKGGAKKEIIDNVTINKHLTRVINRMNSDMYDAVWKGLKKSETKTLNEMSRAANDLESWGRIVDNHLVITDPSTGKVLYEQAATPQVLDAYVARKRMMELTKDTINNSLRTQAKASGVKLFNGNNLARQVQKLEHDVPAFDLGGRPMQMTPKLEEQGYVAFKVDGADDEVFHVILSPEQAKAKVTDVPDTYDMMPVSQDGYMRVEYTAPYRVVELEYATDAVTGAAVPNQKTALIVQEISTLDKEIARLEKQFDKVPTNSHKQVVQKQLVSLRNTRKEKQALIRDRVDTVALEQADIGKQGLPRPSVKPIATADTTRDAAVLVEQARKEGRTLFAVRAEPGQMDAAFSQTFMSSFIRMSEEHLDSMLAELRKSGYSEEVIAKLRALHTEYGKFQPAYKSASALKARAEERLPHIKVSKKKVTTGFKGETDPVTGEILSAKATTEVKEVATKAEPKIRLAKDADASYLSWAADYVGNAAYMEELKNGFIEAYGKHLTNPADFLSPIRTDITPALADEIKAYQDQLILMTGRHSELIAKADKKIKAVADKVLLSDKPGAKFLGKTIDENLMASGLIRTAGSITTMAKLGLLNFVQLPLQMSFGVLSGTGASVGRIVAGEAGQLRALGSAYTDFFSSLAPRMFKGVNFTKGGKEAHEFLSRWGVLDDIDWDTLSREMSDMRKNRGWFGKSVDRSVKTSSIPFTEGEKLNQAFGVLVSKRVMEAEIKQAAKAGKAHRLGLTLKDLENGGSARFGREVLLRGKTLSLNMSRHNAPGFAQNEITALILKFKEFVSHGTNLYLDPFLTKNLSKRESLGIWATTLAVLGPKGIPGVWDALVTAELIDEKEGTSVNEVGKYTVELFADAAYHMEDVTGGLISDKAWFRWMTQGADSALTEGQWALGNRLAIGMIFSDYLDGAGNDDALLGAVYSTITGLVRDGVNTADLFVDQLRNQELDFERLAFEATGELTGPNNLLRANHALQGGRLLSRKGKPLSNKPSLTEIIQTAIGVTPGKVKAAYDLQEIKRRKTKAISEWTKAEIPSIIKTYNLDVYQGEAHLRRVADQLREVDPALQVAFLRSIPLRLRDSALDVKQKAQLDAAADTMFDVEVKRIMGVTD